MIVFGSFGVWALGMVFRGSLSIWLMCYFCMVFGYMLSCMWVRIGCGCFGWHVEVGSQNCVVLEYSLGCVCILWIVLDLFICEDIRIKTTHVGKL